MAARGASVILGVLLGVAGVVACGGADDTEDQTQAGAESSDNGSGGDNGDNGDNNGGAPGVPAGSGGGAVGAPIEIPAIQQVGAISLEEARRILEEGIRAQCPRGDVCVVLQDEKTGDGQDCIFGGTDPPSTEPGTFVDPEEDTVTVFATCEGETEGETDTGTDTDTEIDGEGETDTGTDTDTETDTGGEGETEGTP